jgi:5-methylcytosine-specific restriction endonuclease McrA
MSLSLKDKRARAFESQEGKCFYCGFRMWMNEPSGHPLWSRVSPAALNRFQCTAEHKVARTDGGSDARRNIVAACRFCNEARHRRPIPPSSETFKKLVTSRVRRRRWHPREYYGL